MTDAIRKAWARFGGCKCCFRMPEKDKEPTLSHVKSIYGGSHVMFFVEQCEQCGQLFLYEFKEGPWVPFDDLVERYIPLTQEEYVMLHNQFPNERIASEHLDDLEKFTEGRDRLWCINCGEWKFGSFDPGGFIPLSV